MTDARLTLLAAYDSAGTPTCVVPTDHGGFTQEVEDCMAARVLATPLGAGAPASTIIPVVARAGTLSFGPPKADTAALESVETIRMPDAFDVLDLLQPQLLACLRGAPAGGAKSLDVAARIGSDGRAECALAATPGTLPPAVLACAAGVLRGATFPPPKKGSGLVVVPILLPSR